MDLILKTTPTTSSLGCGALGSAPAGRLRARPLAHSTDSTCRRQAHAQRHELQRPATAFSGQWETTQRAPRRKLSRFAGATCFRNQKGECHMLQKDGDEYGVR